MLFSLLSLLATIGVAIAVFFLIINIKYQNHRLVNYMSDKKTFIHFFLSVVTFRMKEIEIKVFKN